MRACVYCIPLNLLWLRHLGVKGLKVDLGLGNEFIHDVGDGLVEEISRLLSLIAFLDFISQ